jgi:RNA polymerase sigma-70 factor (ECF subfamily)
MIKMTNREFEILIQRIRPRLVAFAEGFIKTGAATAEDMVQEAALKLWNNRDSKEIRNPEALTVTILRNVCLDYIRVKKNNNCKLDTININAYSTDFTETLDKRERFSSVAGCINSLPPDQMMAIRLRDIMGCEMNEIAVILNTSEQNVRTLLSRGRQKIREKLFRDET